MTPDNWSPLVDLPAATPWLLEASAGTGKTYQLASLVLRLVGEYGIAIERILAMTFTNAATSELRERVRARLEDAWLVLEGVKESDKNDNVLPHVRAQVGDDKELARRYLLALQCFDAAPIRTIHGFSQSILQEFAFEAGHDRSLTLVENTAEVIEGLVNDALATLWARSDRRAIAMLDSLKLSRERLTKVAKATIGAQAVVLEASSLDPSSPAPVDPWARLFADFSKLQEAVDAFIKTHLPNGFDLANPALSALMAASNTKVLKGNSHGPSQVARSIDALCTFMNEGGVLGSADLARLTPDGIRNGLRKGEVAESQPFWPFVQAFGELHAQAVAFMANAEPEAAFASTVRARVAEVLASQRAITFDGLIARLAERIAETGGGASPLAERLRERFDAVLVDEFQDTDAAQWAVIDAAFFGHRRLFLIGDPKQAIYSFRGANVHVYLAASEKLDAPQRRTMTENWRSDGTALTAMNTLWRAGSLPFGLAAVDYVRVHPAPKHRGRGITPSLDLRWMDARSAGGVPGTLLTSGAGAPLAAALAADEILTRLTSRAPVDEGVDGSARPCEPQDFAVLVNTNAQADTVREALLARGIPAVCAAKGSIFASDAALWVQRWLLAIASHGGDRDVRVAATTPLVGWSADALAHALEDNSRRSVEVFAAERVETPSIDSLLEHFRRLGERWGHEGFGRLFDSDLAAFGTYPRLLAAPLGERHATDLRHLLELAHAHERQHRPSAGALAAWIAERRTDDSARSDDEALRLESDARAVTIETVHKSKGLEYPIVLLPFAWQEYGVGADDPVKVQLASHTILNLDGKASERRKERVLVQEAESLQEAQRKLYVALTRAKHQTVVWFGPVGQKSDDLAATAIGRLALRETDSIGLLAAETLVAAKSNKGGDGAEAADVLARVTERLHALVASSEGTIATSFASPPAARPSRYIPTQAPAIVHPRAPWPQDRTNTAGLWQTSSFTALVKSADAHAVREPFSSSLNDSEPGLFDEASRASSSLAEDSAPLSAPAIVMTHAGSAAYGTFVHTIFEQVSFSTGAPRGGRALRDVLTQEAAIAGLGAPAADDLERVIPALLMAPIAAAEVLLPRGFSLSSISDEDRLDELAFDVRLGDGTAWSSATRGTTGIASLDTLFRAMRSAPQVLPSAWVDDFERRLRGGRFAGGLLGILRGAIDLTFRVHGAQGSRYFIADYKTNRLPGDSLASYTRSALLNAMVSGDYLLQALLYTVVLHRELGLRLPGYRYDEHVGGFLYLFLRGMSSTETWDGAATPGVYADRFPESLVTAVSQALDAGDFQ